MLPVQIVVLAGGTNDFHNTTISPDNHVINGAYGLQPVADWVDMYVNYVQQVGVCTSRQLLPQHVREGQAGGGTETTRGCAGWQCTSLQVLPC